jgi:cysteine desulfurase
MTRSGIYLDYQAGTPTDPGILSRGLESFSEIVGNPSSSHSFGKMAGGALENARSGLAESLSVDPSEIIFTSGSTESNSLALRGFCQSLLDKGHTPRVLSSKIEHTSVLAELARIENAGGRIRLLEVGPDGSIDISQVEEELERGIDIVSLMLANNEIGTINPMKVVSRLARDAGAIFHCDASQGLQQHIGELTCAAPDLVSISGHKVYALAGSGALLVRRRVQALIEPLHLGGGQERGLRGGTQNLLGAIVLNEAVKKMKALGPEETERIRRLQQLFYKSLKREQPHSQLIGPGIHERLLGNLMLSFKGIEADMLISNCPDLAISTGSACSAGVPGPSHVLRALPIDVDVSEGALRIGIGRFTTESEVEDAVEILSDAVVGVEGFLTSSRAPA